jgi:hypothetical protein
MELRAGNHKTNYDALTGTNDCQGSDQFYERSLYIELTNFLNKILYMNLEEMHLNKPKSLTCSENNASYKSHFHIYFQGSSESGVIGYIPWQSAGTSGTHTSSHFVLKGLKRIPWQSQSLTNSNQLVPGLILEIE